MNTIAIFGSIIGLLGFFTVVLYIIKKVKEA